MYKVDAGRRPITDDDDRVHQMATSAGNVETIRRFVVVFGTELGEGRGVFEGLFIQKKKCWFQYKRLFI